jgi:hypothetical protein
LKCQVLHQNSSRLSAKQVTESKPNWKRILLEVQGLQVSAREEEWTAPPHELCDQTILKFLGEKRIENLELITNKQKNKPISEESPEHRTQHHIYHHNI